MDENLPDEKDAESLPPIGTDQPRQEVTLPNSVNEPTLTWRRVIENWEEYKKRALDATNV